MAPVLLGVAGLDAFEVDAEAQPPDRQAAQAEEGVRAGEGDAVVGADGAGQAELLESVLEDGERRVLAGAGERLAGEQVATDEVGDGERVAVAMVGEHELALEVGAPELVRLAGPGEGCALSLVAPPSPSRDQAVSIEYGVDGADGGGLDPQFESAQLLADLGRAPGGVFLAQLEDPALELEGQLVGLAVGPAAAIGEALEADIAIAPVELVAGLAGDAELSAQHRHLVAFEQPGHEP